MDIMHALASMPSSKGFRPEVQVVINMTSSKRLIPEA